MGSSESNLSNTGSSKTGLAQNRKHDQAVAVGAPAAAAPKGTTKLVSGSGSQEKMMKAPGRDYRMPRKDFETSPAGYFRDLRAPKGTTKLVSGSGSQEKMMKAPGRDYRMPRKEFETSPAGYFRDLRKK